MKKTTKTKFAVWLLTMYVMTQLIIGAWLAVDVIPDRFNGYKVVTAFIAVISDCVLIIIVADQAQSWKRDQ